MGGSSGMDVCRENTLLSSTEIQTPCYLARTLATIKTMLSRHVIRDFYLEF
jgi:hypothetical protein